MFQYFYNRFTIGGKFLGLILPFGLTAIMVMGSTYSLVKKMSIESEEMHQVMATAALNGDVQPPLLFIAESHHEIREGLLIEEEDCVSHTRKGLTGLQAYEKSRDHWKKDLPGSVRVKDIFSSLDKSTNSYINTASVLQVGLMCGESFETKKGIADQLSSLYSEHARLADLLSRQLIQENAKYQKVMVEMDRSILGSIQKLIFIGVSGLVVIGIFAVRLSFRVGHETNAVQKKAEMVATGDLTVKF